MTLFDLISSFIIIFCNIREVYCVTFISWLFLVTPLLRNIGLESNSCDELSKLGVPPAAVLEQSKSVGTGFDCRTGYKK